MKEEVLMRRRNRARAVIESQSWVCRVLIGEVNDDIDLATFATVGCLAEPNGTIGESLAVVGPVWVAPPAIVDWVSSKTQELVFGAAIVGINGGGG
ncbi:unnamed protein product [Camellia sinensis]